MGRIFCFWIRGVIYVDGPGGGQVGRGVAVQMSYQVGGQMGGQVGEQMSDSVGDLNL